MDFKLSEEQELVRQNMREFAQTYVDPIAVEIDENSRYPEEVIKRLGAMGWMGIMKKAFENVTIGKRM